MFFTLRIHMLPVALHHDREIQAMMGTVIHPHVASKYTHVTNKKGCSFLLRFNMLSGNIFGTYPTDFSIKDAF